MFKFMIEDLRAKYGDDDLPENDIAMLRYHIGGALEAVAEDAYGAMDCTDNTSALIERLALLNAEIAQLNAYAVAIKSLEG